MNIKEVSVNIDLQRCAYEIAGERLLADTGLVAAIAGKIEDPGSLETIERLVRQIAHELIERATREPQPSRSQIEKKLDTLGVQLLCNRRGKVKYFSGDGYKNNYPKEVKTIHLPGGSQIFVEHWREHSDYYHVLQGTNLYLFGTWREINTWVDERLKEVQ